MELVLALTPQSNEAFLREVDEELRRDQVRDFGVRYGRLLLIAIVVGLAIFAGVLYWQHRQQEAAGIEGQRFGDALTALGAGNEAAAQKPLAELATSKLDGYRAGALFTQADILLQKDDLKGAAAKFAAVANDASLPRPFRDLALIRQTSAEYDTLKPQVVVSRLRGLAMKGQPWLGSAGEMVAVAYLRMNQPDRAGALFGEIARDETVPETLRQRAVQMASALGVDAAAKNEESKAQ